MFDELNTLLLSSNLSAAERSDLYAMTGMMADEDSPQEDYLVMYLSGDRNWKEDFAKIYGRQPGETQ